MSSAPKTHGNKGTYVNTFFPRIQNQHKRQIKHVCTCTRLFFFIIPLATPSIVSRLNTKTSPQSIFTYYFITAGPFPPPWILFAIRGSTYVYIYISRALNMTYSPSIDIIEFNLRGRVTIV